MTGQHESRRKTVAWGRALVPLLLGPVLGALAGWLWWSWWGPPPDGKVFESGGEKVWYPVPFDPGVTRDFGGTATYVLLALVLSVALGVVAAWLLRRTPLVALGVALASAALAGVAMTVVGVQLSPPDPSTLLAEREVGDELPGHLHVSGWTPYLVWPGGALLGLVVLLLGLGVGSDPPSHEHRA